MANILLISIKNIMKKTIITTLLILFSVWLVSCGSDVPLTESEQAKQYNLSLEEYKEMKDAAARMNMTIEEHMKHVSVEWWDSHDMHMSDDSHMIEDDHWSDSHMIEDDHWSDSHWIHE